MTLIVLVLASYIIGGIPTGIWVSKLVTGTDPREHGSGSSGATNVSRVLGKAWGIAVLIIDALKGFMPTYLAGRLALTSDPLVAQIACGGAAILGHVFTPFARFRGGKGVATASGAMLAISSSVLGLALLVWAAVFAVTRIVSVASLSAVVALPVIAWLIRGEFDIVVSFSIALAAFIVFTHRGNIRRLFAKREQPIA